MSEKNEDIYQTINEAMYNSYLVIVQKKDPLELIYEDIDDQLSFAHHIDEPLAINDIDRMIKWWEQEEEYEMCGELLRIKNGITRLSKRNSPQRA
tara:strand:- start:914 stop:1198 length:285 start_codon:yes stop_codon:yes gene_type:complete